MGETSDQLLVGSLASVQVVVGVPAGIHSVPPTTLSPAVMVSVIVSENTCAGLALSPAVMVSEIELLNVAATLALSPAVMIEEMESLNTTGTYPATKASAIISHSFELPKVAAAEERVPICCAYSTLLA